MRDFYTEGETGVALINGEVECAVLTQPGTMRLDQTDLPLCVVAAVTTSRIARGLSLAQKLTARQLVKGQQAGASVATLGMFDQGFYNKVGFGTGAYVNEFAFDPGSLDVSLKARTPVRLGVEQADEMLAAMVSSAGAWLCGGESAPDVQGRAEHGRRCFGWATRRLALDALCLGVCQGRKRSVSG